MFYSGRHIFFQHVVGMSYNSSTSLLLGAISTSHVVGIFSGAERIARMPLMPIAPYRQIFFPIIAELVSRDIGEAARSWRRLARLAMGIMAICSFTLFVFAEPIVSVALGPQFSDSAPVLRILAFLPVIVAAGELVSMYWLIPLEKDKAISYCLVISLIAHLILMCALGFTLGAIGAALAAVLSQGLFLVAAIWVWLRAGQHKAQ